MNCPNQAQTLRLRENMRMVWEQHIYWTRLIIISIAERLADQSATTARLLRNPSDIAKIFAQYYPAPAAKTIELLLTEHLQIGAALITALRDGKTAEANNLTHKWYKNADEMAEAFAAINPCYKRMEVQKMFYTHLELTTQEVSMRLGKNYTAEIEVFNKAEDEMISMADYFTTGIMRQFPRKFS